MLTDLREHYSTARHNLGFYRGIANACQYMISKETLQGQSVQYVIEEAVARLVVRLSGLKVGIIDEHTNKACFVRVPSMNLQDCIEWKTVAAAHPSHYDEQVLQAMKNRLEQLWSDVVIRPAWKLIVVQSGLSRADYVVLDLVLATHHALVDGKSTTVFHTELLRELNGPPGPPPELKNRILTFDQPPVLAPSQEDLVDLRISWSFMIKTYGTSSPRPG